MSMEIDLAAFPDDFVNTSKYTDLHTERLADAVCPHCNEDLYMGIEQKNMFIDNAWEHEENTSDKYACTCPNCGRELVFTVGYEIAPFFDIEGC